MSQVGTRLSLVATGGKPDMAAPGPLTSARMGRAKRNPSVVVCEGDGFRAGLYPSLLSGHSNIRLVEARI
jgi:hypothetical protein